MKAFIRNQLSIRYGSAPDGRIVKHLAWELSHCDQALERYFVKTREISLQLERRHIPFCCVGAGGGTFLSYLLGITSANPLTSHYHCPNCHHIKWVDSKIDGFDLLPKPCKCGELMEGDGHNCIPEYFFAKGQNEQPIRFFVQQESLPFCLSLAPEDWFQVPDWTSPWMFEDNSRQRLEQPDFGQRLPFTLRLRNLGLEKIIWRPEFSSQRLATILQEHYQEAFVFREDLYQYLVDERHIAHQDAVKYAERIRKAIGADLVDKLFPKDDWRHEYCKAICYLPSRAATAEELVRLRGRCTM